MKPVLIAVALGAAGVLAAPAAAQVSRFQPPQPWFGLSRSGVLRGPVTHPIGTIGPNQVGVDQDGDAEPDVVYDLPPAIRADTQSPSRWSFDDHLSPAQRVLFTRRFRNPIAPNPPPVCDGDPAGHEVFFHRLDTPPAMTLLGSACLRGPLSRQPAFYEPNPAAVARTAVIVAAPNGPSQEVAWFDLAGGGAGEDGATYQPNVSVTAEGVLVSPFGNAFYLRHRTGQLGQQPRYSIVDLCASRTGTVVTTRDEPSGATAIRVEHRVDGSDLFADVTFSLATGSEQTQTFALQNCFGGSPPALRRLTVTVAGSGTVGSNPPGIACLPNTTCQADFADGASVQLLALPAAPGTVFAGWSGDCSGTQTTTQVTMDADHACTATFGTVQLAVAKAADAATALPGQTLTYTLTVSNLGSAAATNVVVSDTLPAGTDFVAAPGGAASGPIVNWSLGTLAAGASAPVQLQVQPRCQVAQVRNDVYSADADAVAPVVGTPVVTPVGAPPTSPVTAVVTSVPDRLPLRGGDHLTHTITLTNNGPGDHPYLRLVTLLGDAASLDALIDAGTGAFSFVPPTTLTWTGPLAAGATTSLVLRVRIDDCFSANRTALNSGTPVGVFNFCSQSVGSAQPAGPFALQRPVEATLTAVDPRRTTQGTLPALRYVVGRPGEPFDLQLTVRNNFPTPASGVTVNAALPAGLSAVGNPPFVPPTDPGAAWDAAARTVSWSGTVPATGAVTVTFRVEVDAGARCWMNIPVVGSRAGCSDIRDGLLALATPGTPATPHVIAVDVLEGLYLWEPGVDRNFRELLCVHAGEFHAGLGRTAGGDLWMAGLPSFRANLSPLEIEAFAPGFFDTPAVRFDEENDVAGHPADGTVVVLGGRGGAGAVKRYDPATRQTTDIATLPSRAGRVLVEPDGTIAALAGDRIYRLDPASPGNPQSLTFPGYAGLGGFDRDTDGDYVVLAARASGGGFAEDLVEVDVATGVVTPILMDLDAATGNTTVPHGPLAVAPDGAVYLSQLDGRELFRVDRSTAPPAVTRLSLQGTVQNPSTPGVFLTSLRDLVFAGGAPPAALADLALAKTASPDPVTAGGSLTFTLTATNGGPDAATQVVVTDPLPAGVVFDAAASDPRCAEAAGTVTCTLGDVPAGQALSAAVVVTVAPAATGTIVNTATVAGATADPDGTNDTATATVTAVPPPPPMADLAVTKAAAPDPLPIGQDLAYTLTASNDGPAGATGVRIDDVLPSILAFEAGGTSPECTAAGAAVSCAIGALPVGAQASVTLAARPLLPADLAVTRLDVTPAGPVVTGEGVVYAIEVANHGPGDARGVRLTTLASGFDPGGSPLMPLDVTFAAAQSSRGSCAALGPNGRPPVTCTLGQLLPGESARVTIVATPNAPTTAVGQPGPPLTNAARVTTDDAAGPDLDPHPANDERSVATVVLPANGPDLAIVRAEAPPGIPLVLGGALTYELEVANVGAGTATDVRLHTLATGFDPAGLPTGPPLDVTVLSISAGQGTCTDLGNGAGPIACALGTLGAGARVPVTVVVRPNSATAVPGLPSPPLVNRARVTTAGAIAGTPVDPHRANDEAAMSAVVLPAAGAADLAVTALAVTPSRPVPRGGDLTYALTITNFGPEPVDDVVLFTMAGAFTPDGRPAGPPLRARLVSVGATQGACTDLGSGNGPVQCLMGTLPAGASADVTLAATPEAATVQPGVPDDPLVNGASVTTAAALGGGGLDPHAANDRRTVSSTILERLPDTIDNQAAVSSLVPDAAPGDNTAVASTPLVAPVPPPAVTADLGVALSGPVQASLGAGTEYTMTVTNAGPDTAPGAAVVVTLSAGLTLSAISPSAGSCAGSRAAHCDLGNLPAGAAVTVTLVLRPRAAGTQGVDAEVAAFGAGDPAPANNRASLVIQVGGPPPEADLVLDKTADADRVTAGDALSYQIAVTNRGPAPATGVRVVDALPAGVGLALAAPSQGTCSLDGANLICALGALLDGGSATVALTVSVPRGMPGGSVLVNWAGVVAEQADPVPGDNEDAVSVTVDQAPPQPGENIDPSGGGEQYAYGENVGWINLEPLGDGGPGVEVTSTGLTGWMWGENVGWCNLSCAGTGSCGAVDFGVTHAGDGVLAGWAWCENAGWISFSCTNTATCATSPYGVVVDPTTGVFGGQAWGENVGWIGFSGSGIVPYRIVTAWRGAP